MAEGKAECRQRISLDMIPAAAAKANDCVMATANERDFKGRPMFNPLRHEVQGTEDDGGNTGGMSTR